MAKKVISVDAETGEILDYTVVVVPRRAPIGFREGWIVMAQTALELLATSDLRGDDLRVLLLLMARLDFENLTNVPQADLANKLGMHKQSVNRSIKRLVALGCLLEGPKIGRNRTYRLNPNYGWKGSGKEHQKALRTHERAAAAGLKVHRGGKSAEPTDAEIRAKLEAEGQTRLID